MNCLNCGEEMVNHFVQTTEAEISYDICEGCGSFWLDKGELDKMAFQVDGSIEESSTESTDKPREQARKCPRCKDKSLGKVNFIKYSDIVLDRCSRCEGLWLDGGEFDLINRELEKIMPVHAKGFSDFVNNAHIPYWHKRLRRRSGETDFEVEVPPIKGAELLSATDYRCPACESALSRYKCFGIELEGCPKCRGVFLDRDELRRLKDRAAQTSWHNLRWMDDEVDAIEKANITLSKRACPKCEGASLLTINFGDSTVLIDYCPQCHGTWLDEDELQEIVSVLTSKLNAYSSKEAAKKAWEEIKEVWKGPEGKISEVLDATAVVSALINITIFEHPALYRRLTAMSDWARSAGLG